MKIAFTIHVSQRIEKRKLLEQEVLDTIHYPDVIVKKHGAYYYRKKFNRGTLELVCERTETHIKIITLYWV